MKRYETLTDALLSFSTDCGWAEKAAGRIERLADGTFHIVRATEPQEEGAVCLLETTPDNFFEMDGMDEETAQWFADHLTQLAEGGAHGDENPN